MAVIYPRLGKENNGTYDGSICLLPRSGCCNFYSVMFRSVKPVCQSWFLRGLLYTLLQQYCK